MINMTKISANDVPEEINDIFAVMYKWAFNPTLVAQIIHGTSIAAVIATIILYPCAIYWLVSIETDELLLGNVHFIFWLLIIVLCKLSALLKIVLGIYNPLKGSTVEQYTAECGISKFISGLSDSEEVYIFRPRVYCDSIQLIAEFFSASDRDEHLVYITKYINIYDNLTVYHVIDPLMITSLDITVCPKE